MSECRITLKGGEVLDLNMSTTRLKHMRRSGGVIVLQGKRGKKILLEAKYIAAIESLAPAESQA